MKENKYDDINFFNKYSQMNRSKDGLESAGEWEAFQRLLPDVKDKRVLDLGCGYGWHCMYAAENGAKRVVGVDISERMLEVARDKNHFENIEYLKKPIEDVDFPNDAFDVVISSLAFHYVQDFRALALNIYRMLTTEGQLVFSAEHPIFTAHGSQDWIYNEHQEIEHFPVDYYFDEGDRKTQFLDESVTKYHRSMTSYVNTLIDIGFKIEALVEPTAPEHMMNVHGMKHELRRPMMLIISASKI